ncbi:MAG: hypothetical protein U0353_13175 [Sandaracinus sp.]
MTTRRCPSTAPRLVTGFWGTVLSARALLLACAIAASQGCGSSEERVDPRPTPTTETPTSETPPATSETPPPTSETPPPTADPGEGDPLADLAEPVREDEVVTALPSALAQPTLAAGTCEEVAETPVRVLPRSSAMSIVGAHDRFFLAGYEPLEGGREQVSIVELVPGQAPRLVVSIPVEAPVPAARRTAAPALGLVGAAGDEAQELGVAWIDEQAVVHAAFFDPARPAPRPVDLRLASADLRFSPALTRIGLLRVVAATIAIPENVPEGQPPRTAMRMHVARVDGTGRLVGSHDVTPRAGAGSHPVFSAGAGAQSELFFLDARVALSVLHRVTFDAEAVPAEATVARPINLSAEPPSFAIVHLAGHDLAAYAAVGNMATRAVGLVELGGTENPDPVVPGLGYGQPLTVSGVSRALDAVVASEAPSAVTPDAPHEVRVRSIRYAGSRTLGAPLVLSGALRPAIASTDDGVLGVAIEGGLVRFVRCG